jgi:hypothetical protein
VDLAEQEPRRDGAALFDDQPDGERQEQQRREREQRPAPASALG